MTEMCWVLLLVLSTTLLYYAHAINASDVRLQRTGGRYEVCTSSWTPMVSCVLGGSNQSLFSGFQVDLARALVQALNWTDNGWYFRCMTWSSMLQDLASTDGTCFMAAAGVTASEVDLEMGLAFAWPNYYSGLRVLVYQHDRWGALWDVFAALDSAVWAALGGTMAAVSFVYWGFTRWYEAIDRSDLKRKRRKARDKGIPLTRSTLALWRAGTASAALVPTVSLNPHGAAPGPDQQVADAAEYGSGMQSRHHAADQAVDSAAAEEKACASGMDAAAARIDATNKGGSSKDDTVLPASLLDAGDAVFTIVGSGVWIAWPEPSLLAHRLVILGYGFLLLLLTTVYGANTAALLTRQQLAGQITSKDDLPGHAVAAWSGDLTTLAKYGIAATGMAWEDSRDEAAMLQALSGKQYNALVLDAAFINHVAAHACRFHAVGPVFERRGLAFAFPKDTPVDVVDKISWMQVRLQEKDLLLDRLSAMYVAPGAGRCQGGGVAGAGGGTSTGTDAADQSVHFSQVRILWILLAASVLAAALYMSVVTHAADVRLRRAMKAQHSAVALG